MRIDCLTSSAADVVRNGVGRAIGRQVSWPTGTVPDGGGASRPARPTATVRWRGRRVARLAGRDRRRRPRPRSGLASPGPTSCSRSRGSSSCCSSPRCPAMVLADGRAPVARADRARCCSAARSPAGGANTINCWIERDRDQVMRRTHATGRSPTGQIAPDAGARVRRSCSRRSRSRWLWAHGEPAVGRRSR